MFPDEGGLRIHSEDEQIAALRHLIDEQRGHIEHLEETNRAHLDEIRLLRQQLAVAS